MLAQFSNYYRINPTRAASQPLTTKENMNMTTTTNLAQFGARELAEVRDLLDAMLNQGLPSGFSNDGVHPMFNMNSGFVFLTNDEFEVCMMNGDKLESFHTSPYEGKEGFFSELLDEYSDMHGEDKEWFRELSASLGLECPSEDE